MEIESLNFEWTNGLQSFLRIQFWIRDVLGACQLLLIDLTFENIEAATGGVL